MEALEGMIHFDGTNISNADLVVTDQLQHLADRLKSIQMVSQEISKQPLTSKAMAEFHATWFSKVILQIKAYYEHVNYTVPIVGSSNDDTAVVESLRRSDNPLRDLFCVKALIVHLHIARRAHREWTQSRGVDRFVDSIFYRPNSDLGCGLQEVEETLAAVLAYLRSQTNGIGYSRDTKALAQPSTIAIARTHPVDAREKTLDIREETLRLEREPLRREGAALQEEVNERREVSSARKMDKERYAGPEATALQLQDMLRSLNGHSIRRRAGLKRRDQNPTNTVLAEIARLCEPSDEKTEILRICKQAMTQGEGRMPEKQDARMVADVRSNGATKGSFELIENRKHLATAFSEAHHLPHDSKASNAVAKDITPYRKQSVDLNSHHHCHDLKAQARAGTDVHQTMNVSRKDHRQAFEELSVLKKHLEQWKEAYYVLDRHLATIVASRKLDQENFDYYLLNRPDCNCIEHRVLKELYQEKGQSSGK